MGHYISVTLFTDAPVTSRSLAPAFAGALFHPVAVGAVQFIERRVNVWIAGRALETFAEWLVDRLNRRPMRDRRNVHISSWACADATCMEYQSSIATTISKRTPVRELSPFEVMVDDVGVT